MVADAESRDINGEGSLEQPSSSNTSVPNQNMSDRHYDPNEHSTTSPVKRDVFRHLKILLFGQFISLIMATLWSTQSTLFLQCSLSVPSFSNFWVYILLSFHAIPLYLEGRKIKTESALTKPPFWFLGGKFPLRLSPWKYLGIAFIGVQANYFMMLALKYTTLTSVALFDAFAIPSTMVLSAAILNRKYRCAHLLGAIICLFGMIVNVITDYWADKNKDTEVPNAHGRDDGSEHYPNKLLGDGFAILGGILYGINDVFAERCVRHFGGVNEYLFMMAFWGVMLTATQAAILERKAINAFFHDGACAFRVSFMLLVTFVLCQLVRKMALCRFLLISEATLLNLSMLTSDLYTTIFSVLAQNILPRDFFFVGLALVLSGIFVYEVAPSPVIENDKTPMYVPPEVSQKEDIHPTTSATIV